jgi:predicted RecA/RadA family phage recombinase
MALNGVFAEADSLNYVVPAAVVSGDFVVLGGVAASTAPSGIIGVALTSAAVGADAAYYATLTHEGVYIGTTADAVAVGAALYIPSAAKRGQALTTTATSNFFVGYAIKAKTGVAGNVHVRINN